MKQTRALIVLAAALYAVICGPAIAQPNCVQWNIYAFFKYATVADVDRCLNAGASVNARTEDGLTPLYWAAGYGTAEIVATLLNAGAEVDARTKGDWTPLHMAAMRGTAESVAALLNAGAEVDARAKGDWTPLHFAARYGTAEKVTALLNAGADPMARDSYGKFPVGLMEDRENVNARKSDVSRRLDEAWFE